MNESPVANSLLAPAHAEHCVDCEIDLSAGDLGRSWHYCEYCREAVCPACDVRHACDAFRANKIKKLL